MTLARVPISIRVVVFIAVIQGLTGCTVNFRSVNAIDQKRLAGIHLGDSRKSVERILGQPGEYGVAFKEGRVYKVAAYTSYAGTASIGKLDMNAVSAVTYYQRNQLVEFESERATRELPSPYSDVAKKLKGQLLLGKTSFSAMTKLIGEPALFDQQLGNREASKDIGWFVSSKDKLGSYIGSYIELGFNESGMLSLISIYADHDPEMLSRFAQEFTPSLKAVDFKQMFASNQKTKVNEKAIRDFLKTKPENILDIIKLLGKPGTVGIYKSVVYQSPLLISLWEIHHKGERVRSSRKKDNTLITHTVNSSVLEVKHDVQGRVKEVVWGPVSF